MLSGLLVYFGFLSLMLIQSTCLVSRLLELFAAIDLRRGNLATNAHLFGRAVALDEDVDTLSHDASGTELSKVLDMLLDRVKLKVGVSELLHEFVVELRLVDLDFHPLLDVNSELAHTSTCAAGSRTLLAAGTDSMRVDRRICQRLTTLPTTMHGSIPLLRRCLHQANDLGIGPCCRKSRIPDADLSRCFHWKPPRTPLASKTSTSPPS